MTTVTQRTNFRLDLGLADDETVFTDDEIDALFVRAAAKHASDSDLQEAYVLVLGGRQLRAKHASLADYDQAESSEKLSQIFKHLDTMLTGFMADYTALVKASGTPMKFAKLKKTPTRLESWPDA